MKTKVKTVFTSAAAFLALLLVANLAESKVFYSVKQLLAAHFKASTRVTFVAVAPNAEQRKRIESRLGRKLARSKYSFNVAMSGDRVDGYALFDKELGQHEPIDFATFFDANGDVSRVELVAYREPYGDGIRSERFRRQFVGRDADSGFRIGKDIDIVSGATISSKSMATAVERAAVVLDEMVLGSRDRAYARR
jgi:Na+-translocating ferredoxin:NAD+ oxidoreductase RnfG subunit